MPRIIHLLLFICATSFLRLDALRQGEKRLIRLSAELINLQYALPAHQLALVIPRIGNRGDFRQLPILEVIAPDPFTGALSVFESL